MAFAAHAGSTLLELRRHGATLAVPRRGSRGAYSALGLSLLGARPGLAPVTSQPLPAASMT